MDYETFETVTKILDDIIKIEKDLSGSRAGAKLTI